MKLRVFWTLPSRSNHCKLLENKPKGQGVAVGVTYSWLGGDSGSFVLGDRHSEWEYERIVVVYDDDTVPITAVDKTHAALYIGTLRYAPATSNRLT